MFPHFYIAADTDPVDHVVGMVDVVPSPTPPGSNDDVVDQFVDESRKSYCFWNYCCLSQG